MSLMPLMPLLSLMSLLSLMPINPLYTPWYSLLTSTVPHPTPLMSLISLSPIPALSCLCPPPHPAQWPARAPPPPSPSPPRAPRHRHPVSHNIPYLHTICCTYLHPISSCTLYCTYTLYAARAIYTVLTWRVNQMHRTYELYSACTLCSVRTRICRTYITAPLSSTPQHPYIPRHTPLP